MALKADPPDFIDSGSYSVTNYSGWGRKAVGWALGTVIAVVALGFGVSGGQWASSRLQSLTGLQNENAGSGGGAWEGW